MVRAVRLAPAGPVRPACLAALTALVLIAAGPATPADERAEPFAVATADATTAVAATAEESGSPVTTPLSRSSPALERLLGLGEGIVIGGSGADEFLEPDVAFVLSAAAAGPGVIEARWDIADGYYLYRDKFRFRFPGRVRRVARRARLPAGDDEGRRVLRADGGVLRRRGSPGFRRRGRPRRRDRRRHHLSGLRRRGAVLPADHQDRLAAAARRPGRYRRRDGPRSRRDGPPGLRGHRRG